jgi:hypothetical protein
VLVSSTCVGERTRLSKAYLRQMEGVAEQQSFTFTREQKAAMRMPNGPLSIAAYTWMVGHFALVGDDQPGKDEVHIDSVDKREIYGEYLLDFAANDRMPLCVAETTFIGVWNSCLPYVKIRKYKASSIFKYY